MKEAVYELVDATLDEVYYTLGIFRTAKEALLALEGFPDDERVSDYNDDDYEKIIIRERKFGWTETGKDVFVFERELIYDEENDSNHWEGKIRKV